MKLKAKIGKRYREHKPTICELSGYERLANEIVLQAIHDWKSLDAGHVEKGDKNYTELRNFFKSAWCDWLLHFEGARFNGRDILKWLEAGGEMKLDCD